MATTYRWTSQEEVDRGECPGARSRQQDEPPVAGARFKSLEAELHLTRTASVLLGEGEDRAAAGGYTQW